MRIIISFTFLTLTFSSQAQIPFLSIVGSNENHSSYAATASEDGKSLFMCGFNTNFHYAEIVKYNESGGVDWSLNDPNYYSMNPTSIVQANLVFVGGSIHDTAMIMALDTNGNTMWSRKILFPVFTYSSVVEIQTDSLYLYVITNVVDTTTVPSHTSLSKVDFNGNMIWTRSIPLPFSLTDLAISPISNNVAMLSITGAASVLTILDTSGNILSSHFYPDQCCNVIPAWDSGFIVSQITLGALLITHTDALGNPIWTKKYMDGPNWLAPQSSLMVMNNHLYLGLYDTNQDAGLIKIDTTGNVVWSKNYSQHLGYGILQYIAPTANGNIWMAGMRYNTYDEYFVGQDDTTNSATCISYPSGIVDSLTAVQDSALNIASQTVAPLLLVMNETLVPFVLNQTYECYTSIKQYPSLTDISLYPNPANDLIEFQLNEPTYSSFVIYNSAGQVVESGTINGSTLQLSVLEFPDGVYMFSCLDGNKLL
jgi:hypothetical protein